MKKLMEVITGKTIWLGLKDTIYKQIINDLCNKGIPYNKNIESIEKDNFKLYYS
jgi:hypothetical protein